MLLAVWASIIFITSCFYIPSKHFMHFIVTHSLGLQSESQFNGFWHRWWWLFVKGYHVFEYFILTLLTINLLRNWVESKWAFLYAFALAVSYASTDEWHQTFVPGRGGKWTDVVIDAGGATLAILLSIALATRSRRTKGKISNLAT